MAGLGPKRPKFTKTKEYMDCRYYRYRIRMWLKKDPVFFEVFFKTKVVYTERSNSPEVTLSELLEDIYLKETDDCNL